MLPANLADVTEAYLQAMCVERRPESQRLDFKRELPGRSDAARVEFLKDLCAFANAGGGDVIYGVEEQDGAASELMPTATEAADVAERRLGQVAAAGLEPRIVGLQIRSVPIGGGYALIVRVPASFVGPHRYSVNGNSKFVIRVGTHTNEFRYDELRAAFDRTASLRDRTRVFRAERVAALIGGNTVRPMKSGPVCAVHCIPLQAMGDTELVDVRGLYDNYSHFIFRTAGASRALNLEGLAVYRPGTEIVSWYTQVFRSGALEAVRDMQWIHEGKRVVPGEYVADFVRTVVERFLRVSRDLGVAGPLVVSVSLLRLDGFVFNTTERYSEHSAFTPDRANLVLPEVWIEHPDALKDAEPIWRGMLDLLWQCFGIPKCNTFDRK